MGWDGEGQAENGTEDERPFHVVRRGYDRLEVDARIEYLASQLVAAQDSLQEAQARNAELAAQLRRAANQPQQRDGPVVQPDSFGFRVEKILRLAEEEARAVRTQAAAEAAQMVEQARAEAQAQREETEPLRAAAQQEADQLRAAAEHEAEQLRVTARQETDQLRFTALREAQELRTTVEQETEQLRRAAKQEADELRTTAERDANQLRAAAEQDAERILSDADSRAKALLASVEKVAMDQRELTERETQQLRELHATVRDDLTRTRDILIDALSENPHRTPDPTATDAETTDAETPDA